MPASVEDQRFAQQNATVFHPIRAEDKTAMAGLRQRRNANHPSKTLAQSEDESC
jgi:hypothetical protein